MYDINQVREFANQFINKSLQVEAEQNSLRQTKEALEKTVEDLRVKNKLQADELDICVNALAILSEISDGVVHSSYSFIEENLNMALERIFSKSVRKIRLKETLRGGTSPQLSIELIVEGGKVRSLKADSGHGIMQMISLLCILCVLTITGSRKLLLVDEVLSGLSKESRRAVSDILWSFTEVGFQFIVSEHGFIPAGANVYHLEIDGGVSNVVDNYISKDGVFLDASVMRDTESREEYA